MSCLHQVCSSILVRKENTENSQWHEDNTAVQSNYNGKPLTIKSMYKCSTRRYLLSRSILGNLPFMNNAFPVLI